jgi:predicted Zn-dependent peptidase
MWDPYAEFESATLPNGLTVYAAHWPGRPWEATGFLIHSGAKHDTIGLEGTAHFVEHLIAENTGVPKKEAVDFFEGNGGKVDLGSTSWHRTQYQFWMPTDPAVFSKALSLFGTALLSAKLDKFMERERQVIVAEFHRRFVHKITYDLAMREHKALYSGYWLERSVRPLGHPESLTRITRDDLQSYYDTHYTPANMSIVGVGGLTLQELVKFVSESPFAIAKAGKRTQLPIPITDIAPPLENRYVFEMSEHLKTEVPFEIGAYKSVAVMPTGGTTIAVKMLKEMLDEILTEEVRERRTVTYHIDASFCNYGHFYEFVINCGKLEARALDAIEEIVEACIGSICDRADLFEKEKRCGLAASLMTDLKARDLCENALDELARDQKISSLAEDAREIENLTMDDVRSLLRWLKPERRWTLITKP